MLQLLRPFGVACLRTIETRRRALKLEMHKNGSQVVTLNEEDIDDIEQDWGYCLIGYFVGRHTSAFGLKKVIKRWNDTCKYFLHDSDWIVNKFECENDRDNILHDEPHPIFGSTLILKPMPKCFEFGRVESSLMHVWAPYRGYLLTYGMPSILARLCQRLRTDCNRQAYSNESSNLLCTSSR